MASTASHGALPCYAAAPASAFLEDHHHQQLYLDNPAAAAATSFPATDAPEPHQPPPQPATAEHRKPRKRARASRRAPTTVLTTDASNFRAMVQEFTGFPAPPPLAIAPHHLGPGVLFGAGPSPSGSAAGASFHHQLLRPSPLKLSAAPHAPPNTSSFARTLFANPTATAAGVPSLSSEMYGRFGLTFTGAVPSYGEGFAAEMEGERVEHSHGVATSFLHAGDRYHNH